MGKVKLDIFGDPDMEAVGEYLEVLKTALVAEKARIDKSFNILCMAQIHLSSGKIAEVQEDMQELRKVYNTPTVVKLE